MTSVPIHKRDHSVLVSEALRLEQEGKFVALIQWGNDQEVFRFLDGEGVELSSLPVPPDLDSNFLWENWHEFEDRRRAHYSAAWAAWGDQMRALTAGGQTFTMDQQKQMWLEFYRNFAPASGEEGVNIKMPEALVLQTLQRPAAVA